MQRFAWSDDKNRWLQVHRGMSFEQLRDALLADGLLDILGPSDSARYPNQRRYVIFCEGYTWSVPAVVDGGTVFFKTAYRDRRLDRRYRS